jgi:hypothetical protein
MPLRDIDEWGVPPASPPDSGPVPAVIPALVLSGTYDAGEPAANGRALARRTPRS